MADDLKISRTITIPAEEISFSFVRSSGPGGQNVNKTATKAQLRWGIEETQALPDTVKSRFLSKYGRRISNEGMIVISSDRYRDRLRNQADCLEKLRALVEAVVPEPRKRKKTKPSRSAIERRIRGKKEQSERKQRRRPPSAE